MFFFTSELGCIGIIYSYAITSTVIEYPPCRNAVYKGINATSLFTTSGIVFYFLPDLITQELPREKQW
jgi:hypothetical protein